MTTKQVTNPRGIWTAVGGLLTSPDYDSQTIMVYNAGATAITAGQVLQFATGGLDSTNRPNVIPAATLNTALVCGVAIETIAAGDAGLMAVSGLVVTNVVSGAIAVGALLSASATAGSAQTATAPALGQLLGILVGYQTGVTTQAVILLKLG